MKSLEQVLDTTNLELNFAEYVQAVRDRRILGLSALAGYFEDKFQPDYPNFVRARWLRINDTEDRRMVGHEPSIHKPKLLTVEPAAGARRTAKGKDTAVIIGNHFQNLDDLWDDKGFGVWPAVAYEYKGVLRAGLMPVPFGSYDDYPEAVAMLVGNNVFEVSNGLFALKSREPKNLCDIRRRDARDGRMYINNGVEILDRMLAENLPSTVPLI